MPVSNDGHFYFIRSRHIFFGQHLARCPLYSSLRSGVALPSGLNFQRHIFIAAFIIQQFRIIYCDELVEFAFVPFMDSVFKLIFCLLSSAPVHHHLLEPEIKYRHFAKAVSVGVIIVN
ncbi:MAG: hypothetical protein ABIT07_12980 [Ferruginibacter sp.]